MAELSLRIKKSDQRFTRGLAEQARALYTLWQSLDCARRGGTTKTAYIYGDTVKD